MKKTFTINLAGIVFHVDDDAYDRLQDYLNRVSKSFSAEEGQDEIMSGIESRIAEILAERNGPSKQVVTMADVEHVISMMGEPDVIADESGTKTSSKREEAPADDESPRERRYKRKLYRDPDDKVIGGVCSGLGYYFDVDVVWIRLAFAIIFFAFGTGLLFYILLMIIIPKAISPSEKLEMRGEPADINNIGKTIKEEFEEFGQKAKRKGQEWGRNAKRWGKETRDWERRRARRGNVEDFFAGVFRVMGRIIGFLLLIFGILFLLGLLTSTFSISSFAPSVIGETFRSFFPTGFKYWLAIIAIFLVIGTPVLMMIYKGVKLVFRIDRKDRIVTLSALGIWIFGIILLIYSGCNAARSFAEETTLHESQWITSAPGDTLQISVNIDKEMENPDYHSSWNKKYHYARRYVAVSVNGGEFKLGDPHLHIVESTTDSVELVVFRSAHGWDNKDAQQNAKGIKYPIEIHGNHITFPNYFSIEKGVSWRQQELTIELRIPKNKVIYIASSAVDILDDIDNTSNTIDEDMVDRRWIMTNRGLQCIDCAGLDATPPAPAPVIKKDSAK